MTIFTYMYWVLMWVGVLWLVDFEQWKFFTLSPTISIKFSSQTSLVLSIPSIFTFFSNFRPSHSTCLGGLLYTNQNIIATNSNLFDLTLQWLADTDAKVHLSNNLYLQQQNNIQGPINYKGVILNIILVSLIARFWIRFTN